MILNSNIVTNLNIDSIYDLHKLKPFVEDKVMKINKSQIARELNKNWRTVDKYIHGFKKARTRKRTNCIEPIYNLLKELLSPQCTQIFYYKVVLWRYLKDNHNFTATYGNFCVHLKKYSEFENYFKRRKPSNVSEPTLRYETEEAKQAQLDWKESIDFQLKSGEKIKINIFVLLLSYSRFRVYRLSLSKTQDVLFHFLDHAFEVFGGVPQEILTDNMLTVMDEPRTLNKSGKVNSKFHEFAKNYGFDVKPCIAGRPRTKAKVEAPMKILDEIRAYNGILDFNGLNELVIKINNRENAKVIQGIGRIPLMYLAKEKTLLSPLPHDKIRASYQISTRYVKVNNSSMVNYVGNQYSVPPEFIGKKLTTQVIDGYLYIYSNTQFVAAHKITNQHLNYIKNHYIKIAEKSYSKNENKLKALAKENLKLLG